MSKAKKRDQETPLRDDDYLRLVATWLREPKNRERRGKQEVVTFGPVLAEQIALRLEDIAAELETQPSSTQ